MMEPDSKSHSRNWSILFSTWIIALAATLGAIFIGEVMGQAPCVLCWYQRAFMFPLAIVLAVACLRSDSGGWRYALPLAVLGWLVAGYHLLLYTGAFSVEVKPCGAGPSCSGADMTILGSIPIPLLSFGTFTTIIFLLLVFRKGSDT
jgi:disulfide bond formation protein DsbB